MTMTIAAATARISRQLPDAELSLDAALLASTRLMESMLLARQSDGVETFTGQAALLRLARSQRSLIESQNDMIRVHRELLDTGREVKAIDDDPGSCPNQASLEDAARFVRTA